MAKGEQNPRGGFRTRIKAFAAGVAAKLRRFRQRFTDPNVKLSYFEQVLAVEHHRINERRRVQPDERQHRPNAREPLRKLEPGEHHDPGDHERPTSGQLPEPTETPLMGVNPTALDIEKMRARPIPCTAVGIALSGGGIRSAAFSLGALQALDYHHVVPHADYLSTVSGGGYIGACVTAGMSQGNGKFPFGTSDIRDNNSIGHLRNYSNYLMPRARSQLRNMLEVAAVLLRGLVANGILVFTFLLAGALITFAVYHNWTDLPSGNFLPKVIFVAVLMLKYIVAAVIGFAAAHLPAFLVNWLTSVGSWLG